MQALFAASVSVSSHEPCLVDYVGSVLLVSSTPLAPTILPLFLLQGSPSSTTAWMWVPMLSLSGETSLSIRVAWAVGLLQCPGLLTGSVAMEKSPQIHWDLPGLHSGHAMWKTDVGGEEEMNQGRFPNPSLEQLGIMVPILDHLIRSCLFETPAPSSGPPESRSWLEEIGMETGVHVGVRDHPAHTVATP